MDHQKDKTHAVFKWVQYTPVGQLKSLTDQRLQEIREALIKEVREVGRALHWVEGVIKLKTIEKDKQEQKNKQVKS